MTPPPPTTIEPRPALLPCPFCGNTPNWHEDQGVFCMHKKCVLFGQIFTDESRWNRRPTPQPTREAAALNPRALEALKSYTQADEDGVMVNVSRQALDAAIAVLAHPPKPEPPAEWVADLKKLAKDIDDWGDTHLDGPELEVAIKCHAMVLALINKHYTAPSEGWQWVPKEPTKEMLFRGGLAYEKYNRNLVALEMYRAMLAAAPKASK